MLTSTFRGLTVLLGIMAFLPATRASAQAVPQTDEYQVKAAFLYNFAKFVKWPENTFAAPTDPLTVCVIGNTLVTQALQDTVSGKLVDGRHLAVRPISLMKPSGVCHILFVSTAEQQHTAAILAAWANRGVLTVGEHEGFAGQGAVIDFIVEDNKVRFEINPGAATLQRLEISSKLLTLARIVKTRNREEPNK
jgi:hypothetical protein